MILIILRPMEDDALLSLVEVKTLSQQMRRFTATSILLRLMAPGIVRILVISSSLARTRRIRPSILI